ncbi:class I SAM-dependent methyltransferase [Methanobrevibacter sp. OttesenSCG-928-K11]|nr:class I SAM-dependent methyltransferase [Methanobrevibacter sp. OttesenSCG-928-K11]
MEDEKLIKNARKPKGELGSKLLDRMNESHESMASWGVSHLNINNTNIILDIGCGGGVNLKRFSKIAKNGKIYGIDYSDVSVQKSKELNKDNNLVEVMEGSVSDLPFEDNTFDLITGFETVYFWPDFEEDLKEVYRVLKPGGTFFICNEAVHDENDSKDKYEKIVNLLDMNIYSEDALNNFLEKTGFTDFKSFRKENEDWICTIVSK